MEPRPRGAHRAAGHHAGPPAWAAHRSGGRPGPAPPARSPGGKGRYEVLDGFKRLAHWRTAGHTHVPVVVEVDATAPVLAKVRLLEANSPRRTLSAMDEARVVHAFATNDHLSLPQIVKLSGHGRAWVERRATLGRRRAPEVGAHIAHGRLAATTAVTLASIPPASNPSWPRPSSSRRSPISLPTCRS